jgi:hypothetical protein
LASSTASSPAEPAISVVLKSLAAAIIASHRPIVNFLDPEANAKR